MLKRILAPHRAMAQINGKAVEVVWTRRAHKALARRGQPLVIDMALAYKCMPVKSVHFHDSVPDGWCTARVIDTIALCLRVEAPLQCSATDDAPGRPFSEAITRTATPRRLWFDWRRGEWTGRFDL